MMNYAQPFFLLLAAILLWQIIPIADTRVKHFSTKPPQQKSLQISQIIISLGLICTTIATALRAGLTPQKAYSVGISIIDDPIHKELLTRILIPQGSSHDSKDINLSQKANQEWKRYNMEDQKLLRNLSSQLHNLYELTLLRGTALQASLLSTVSRMEEELLNKSIILAEQAAVKLGGPLAIGFLPAFITIGLLPTIIGMTQSFLAEIGV